MHQMNILTLFNCVVVIFFYELSFCGLDFFNIEIVRKIIEGKWKPNLISMPKELSMNSKEGIEFFRGLSETSLSILY